MAAVEGIGEEIVEVLQPKALLSPTPIDVAKLVDYELQEYGIFVYPASITELKNKEAATDPEGDGPIPILVRAEYFDGLYEGGSRARRPRATIVHELAHAVIHVPVIRRRLTMPNHELLLARVQRGSIKSYEDPEWQAWALAGCILAPRRTIEMTGTRDASALADVYGISEVFMKAHLKRLKIA